MIANDLRGKSVRQELHNIVQFDASSLAIASADAEAVAAPLVKALQLVSCDVGTF